MSYIRFGTKVPGQSKLSSTYAWLDTSNKICIVGDKSATQGWDSNLCQIELTRKEFDYICLIRIKEMKEDAKEKKRRKNK